MGRPLKPPGERARDVPPTGIRIPVDLRAALEREAAINGRTLSGEILRRLRISLSEPAESLAVTLNRATNAAHDTSGVSGIPARAEFQARPVSDAHRMLLSLFDAMGPDKQLALLTVLKR